MDGMNIKGTDYNQLGLHTLNLFQFLYLAIYQTYKSTIGKLNIEVTDYNQAMSPDQTLFNFFRDISNNSIK